MKRKIISIFLIIITLITSIVFVGCGKDKKKEPTEPTQPEQPTEVIEYPTTAIIEEPIKIISEENATKSIKDYDIDSNTIKYKETDLDFEISYKDEKIIYNKNNIIITFKSISENNTDGIGQFINLSIENKSKNDVSFNSNNMIINDTISIPCDLSKTIPASSKVDVSTLIYPETLYENHINNINNISFFIKFDFNDYEKIQEELGEWKKIKLSDYSDKIFRDVTKVVKIETNSIKTFDEPKGDVLFSNDVMDIVFEGFIDNQVGYSRSNNYQKGFLKIVNKSDKFLRINAHDFVLNKDLSINYAINSNECFIPPNKYGYCFFHYLTDGNSENEIINKLKKCDSLAFTVDTSQDLTDEEITSLYFIISFKK